jgi:hypothetical protein
MTIEDNMITDTPTTMRALVISGEGRPAIVKSVLVAQAAVGELLVKVAAVKAGNVSAKKIVCKI